MTQTNDLSSLERTEMAPMKMKLIKSLSLSLSFSFSFSFSFSLLLFSFLFPISLIFAAEESLGANFYCRDISGDPAREKICFYTNRERLKREVRVLKLDERLSQVAQAHAEDMHNRGYFAHESPEGVEMSDRLHSAGISYMIAGENIARYYDVPEEVVSAWMTSSGHRKNILQPRFQKIGVGHYKSYWVQVFTD